MTAPFFSPAARGSRQSDSFQGITSRALQAPVPYSKVLNSVCFSGKTHNCSNSVPASFAALDQCTVRSAKWMSQIISCGSCFLELVAALVVEAAADAFFKATFQSKLQLIPSPPN